MEREIRAKNEKWEGIRSMGNSVQLNLVRVQIICKGIAKEKNQERLGQGWRGVEGGHGIVAVS